VCVPDRSAPHGGCRPEKVSRARLGRRRARPLCRLEARLVAAGRPADNNSNSDDDDGNESDGENDNKLSQQQHFLASANICSPADVPGRRPSPTRHIESRSLASGRKWKEAPPNESEPRVARIKSGPR
jgi:hypothetical protein